MHINHIPNENKKAKMGKAPYNVPMDSNGPSILKYTSGSAQIFDGWQNLRIRHNNEMPEYVISRFIRRAMCIQRELKNKRVIKDSEYIDIIKKYSEKKFEDEEYDEDCVESNDD